MMSVADAMIDVAVLLVVLLAMAAAGLALRRAAGALPGARAEWLLLGLAVGLGVAGVIGLGLAAAGWLHTGPLLLAGLLALIAGGREVGRAVVALDLRGIGRA